MRRGHGVCEHALCWFPSTGVVGAVAYLLCRADFFPFFAPLCVCSNQAARVPLHASTGEAAVGKAAAAKPKTLAAELGLLLWYARLLLLTYRILRCLVASVACGALTAPTSL